MSGLVIREFFALLGLKTDEKDFDKAEQALGNIKSLLQSVLYVSGAVSGAVGFLTHRYVQQANELERWKRLTGDSVQNLDAYRIATEQLGADGEKTWEAMTEVADRASDVVQNIGKLTGDAGESFKALGFTSVKELRKADGSLRDIPELFDDILGRLAEVENQGERTGIAMRLFGDDTGLAIAGLPIDRLRELKQEALELGLVMSAEDVAAAKRFSGALNGLLATFNALVRSGIGKLIPKLTELTKRTQAWLLVHRELIKEKLEAVFEELAEALDFLYDKTKAYLEIFADMVEALGGARNVIRALAFALGVYLTTQVGQFLQAGLGLLNFFKGFNKATLIANLQMLALGAAFVVAFLAWDEFITRLNGGDTVIGDLLEKFDPKNAKPDDTFLVKTLLLIVRLINDATRQAAKLHTALTEGPSEIGTKAAADYLDFGFFGPLGTSTEEVANFLQRAKSRTSGVDFSAEGLGQVALTQGLGLRPPGETSLPPSVSPAVRVQGGPVSTSTGPITVHVDGGGDAYSIAEAVGVEVRREMEAAATVTARKLQGGGDE